MNKILKISIKYLILFLPIFIIKFIIYKLQPGSTGIVYELSAILFIILFILFLKELTQNEAKFKHIIFIILLTPIVIHFFDFIFGFIFNIFKPKHEINNTGVLGLLEFFTDPFPFPTTFHPLKILTNPFKILMECINPTYQDIDNIRWYNISGFLHDYYVLSLIILFHYTLYQLFKQNNKKPILSLIPILNIFILVDICNGQFYWKILLLIPFIRIIYFYKINKILSEKYNIQKYYAIGMTIFPCLFYAKLIYK